MFMDTPLPGSKELNEEEVRILARSFLKPDLHGIDTSKPWRKYNIVLQHGLRTYAAELLKDEIFSHNDHIEKLWDKAHDRNDIELALKVVNRGVDFPNTLNAERSSMGLGHIMRRIDFSLAIKEYGEGWLYKKLFCEGYGRTPECIRRDNEILLNFKGVVPHVS